MRVVHHANLLVDRAGAQPVAGFPGMDLAIMRSPFDPDGHFLSWKPGAMPHVEPDGFAWRLEPGEWTDDERRRIEEIAAEKYAAAAWNDKR